MKQLNISIQMPYGDSDSSCSQKCTFDIHCWTPVMLRSQLRAVPSHKKLVFVKWSGTWLFVIMLQLCLRAKSSCFERILPSVKRELRNMQPSRPLCHSIPPRPIQHAQNRQPLWPRQLGNSINTLVDLLNIGWTRKNSSD